MKKTNSLLTLILFFITLNTYAAKKNICSMTINSSNEINAMKESLSSDEFNFIELVKTNDNDWFNSACESKIQCDVLLISGHFGGTFFGETRTSLSMTELEEASCQATCNGILKKPKEVYLFGCNTLAGKNTDRRTPDEYLQVLLRDGFSQAQAQQVVAFRYSPIGSTFSNRMSHVFDQTPRLYGFNSVSPLGKYSGPLFKKYLQTVSTSYSHQLESDDISTNQSLLKIFSSTSMVQDKGNQFSTKETSPVCYLSASNTKNSRIDKLNWIAESFERSMNLENAIYVADFLKRERWFKKWNNEEKAILNRIYSNEALHQQIEMIIQSNKTWLVRTKAEVLQLSMQIGWTSNDDYNTQITKVLNLTQIPFKYEDMAFVCGLHIQADLNPKDFKGVDWKNQNFKYAIMCLNSNNPAIWKLLDEN